jgi:hypothetical protein
MHENQITYPLERRTTREQRLGLITWTSAAGGRSVWLSTRRSTATRCSPRCPGFLNAFPDRRHLHLIDSVGGKVGRSSRRGRSGDGSTPCARSEFDPPVVLWNHRWDPDKDA